MKNEKKIQNETNSVETEETKKTPKTKKKTGIGKMAKSLIMKGYSFQSTLQEVQKEFPETNFSKKCYYWYRSHLVTDGEVESVPKASVFPEPIVSEKK